MLGYTFANWSIQWAQIANLNQSTIEANGF